ncbi:type II toxin-antitoxin system VapC family toxin [Candidatus Bathyarchaeota archaeon]|nr:type II toxin-antitoxin system VapC family toxin [Candidatus Bathyarchaeota archaeon]
MNAQLIYLDTSAIVKRYIGEKGSEVTDTVYERSEAGSVIAAFSVWNIGETIGVLDRYHSRKLITSNEFESALSDLVGESTKMLRLNSLLLLPVTSRAMVESWRLIMTHHIYEADALQLSSCQEAGCQLFLSADNALVQAARKEGIEAIDIERETTTALGKIT